MRVLLMRHAKSSWKEPSLADHDRPLKKRGRADAVRMAIRLRDQAWVPDEVITSSAVRARQTAEIVSAELGLGDPAIEPVLYHCGTDVWRDLLSRREPDRLSLWVGHNPGLEEFLTQCAGEFVRFPTAAIALLKRAGIGAKSSMSVLQVWTPRET